MRAALSRAEVVLPPVAAAALRPAAMGLTLQHLQGQTMGTVWQLRAYSAMAEAQLRGLVEAEIDRCLQLFSPWLAESELCRINASAAGAVPVSPPFAGLLAALLAISALSDGGYDPSLGALVDLWGFGPPGPRQSLPDRAECAAAQAVSGWQKLCLQRQPGLLHRPQGLRLDLCAAAKGWAVDQIAAALAGAGIGAYFIEIGGECLGQGLKPDWQPWWVDIEPAHARSPRQRVALSGACLATSGDSQRQWRLGEQCYAHMLDGQTGAPLQGHMASVSVIAAGCAVADAWATALMVLDLPRAQALAKAQGIAAFWQDHHGGSCASPAWEAMRHA